MLSIKNHCPRLADKQPLPKYLLQSLPRYFRPSRFYIFVVTSCVYDYLWIKTYFKEVSLFLKNYLFKVT